jgi:hypothetical protein
MGRIVFELGAAFKGYIDPIQKTVFRDTFKRKEIRAAQNCVELHDKWCEQAREGIRCWLVVGRRRRDVKDIRQMIARMLWEQRAEFSEGQVGWRLVLL